MARRSAADNAHKNELEKAGAAEGGGEYSTGHQTCWEVDLTATVGPLSINALTYVNPK